MNQTEQVAKGGDAGGQQKTGGANGGGSASTAGPSPTANYGSFIPNVGAFAPQSINNFGGVTTMSPTSYQAQYQQYLNNPQAYSAAFNSLDPNTAYQTYGQNDALLRQSAQPGNAMALQAAAAQNAASGLTNSSANSYNLGNVQQQQQAALAGQDANLLSNAQNQYGQFAMQNQSQGNQTNQFNAGAQNTASLAGYQGLLGQMSANQNAGNQAAEYGASSANAASQFNAQNMNAATGAQQAAYNNWLQSLQNEQFGVGNAALEQYLASFGDTSSAGILGQAGQGATSAYNNAFNAQNTSNNVWSSVLGSGLGAAGSVFQGKG
jgi:hypothetical protein